MRQNVSWGQRIDSIIGAVEAMTCENLNRSDMEAIFRIQRRAALRMMEKFNPERSESGEWFIRRIRLVEWLNVVAKKFSLEKLRMEGVRRAISRSELEKQQMREQLRERGLPTPTWKVSHSVFEHRVLDLPEAIRIRPGEVAITFSPDDPEAVARLLHELSLAMMNDWQGFCSQMGVFVQETREQAVEGLLHDLEITRAEGFD